MNPKALLTLTVLPDRYAICRLNPAEPTPAWATGEEFVCIARTRDELSIVCPERNVPSDVACLPGWRTLKCEGPLDCSLTGVVASLAEPLAAVHIPIFPVATHDTDYLLIQEPQLEAATHALTAYGHAVRA